MIWDEDSPEKLLEKLLEEVIRLQFDRVVRRRNGKDSRIYSNVKLVLENIPFAFLERNVVNFKRLKCQTFRFC